VFAVGLGQGKYRMQFYPQLAGTYEVHVTLAGIDIQGSPYSVVVVPGEVKSSICTTSIPGTPINTVAGITYFFEIQLVDVFGNLLTSSATGT
jgi:hypothetical protein